jgi:5-methylcytosine-specific restriction endonuclease McrA
MRSGRAAVLRRYPFTIIVKDRTWDESVVHPHRVKIDPGSKVSGMPLVREDAARVVWAAQIEHRGEEIKRRLLERRALRRGRRNRKTRYRKPRFQNRRRPEGWLPPSLESRVANVLTWAGRLRRLAPVAALSMELVRFDTQKLQNSEVSGVEYQHGELFGYEIREYLLEKFNRTCAYCGGLSGDQVLEIEHIVPKRRGGTDRVANLVIACDTCNDAKDNRTPGEWAETLAGSTSQIDRVRREHCTTVQARAKASLKDAAAVNATRWAIWRRLADLGLPVEAGTGGRTKWNRARLGLPKAHWTDAACVGASTPERLLVERGPILMIRATGHGTRRRCGTDAHGFPVRHAPRRKRLMGYQTGDLVRAVIPGGKHAGVHAGRVAIRFRPSFRLNGFDVHPKYLRLLQRADGYAYAKGDSGASSPT